MKKYVTPKRRKMFYGTTGSQDVFTFNDGSIIQFPDDSSVAYA